jgi:hypothetical protein
MPLIKNFKATDVWRAFLLNSILSAIVIFIALTVKSNFDNYRLKKGQENKNDDTIDRTTNSESIILTLLFTFIASFASYTLMYWIFGFGGGMIAH